MDPTATLWFTEPNANKVGRITTSGVMSEFIVPSTGGTLYEITVGPDGALWVAANSKLVRMQLSQSRTGSLCHIAAGGPWVTDITIVNTAVSPVPVTVGNRLGSAFLLMPPNGHQSFVLPSQVTSTSGRRGLVRFQSSSPEGVLVLGLRFSPYGTFTSVPTLQQ